MRTRLFFAMPIALAAVVIIGGVALATPAVGLTSTPASRSSRTRWSPVARSGGIAIPARA